MLTLQIPTFMKKNWLKAFSVHLMKQKKNYIVGSCGDIVRDCQGIDCSDCIMKAVRYNAEVPITEVRFEKR